MSKIGFCFTGEGARGSIQSGIALQLHNQGINANYTIGTSSGSCNAAGYAYNGPEGLADMWRNIHNIFDVFSFNWGFLWKTGFLNQKPAEKLVKKMTQNQPICPTTVLRLHIETGEIQYVNNTDVSTEEFTEAVLGSFAINAMVQDRNGWVDAGSRQMSPLKQCIDAGCDDIYVIFGRPFTMPQWKMPTGIGKWIWMAYRALDLSLFEILSRDIKSCLKKNGEPGFKNIKIHIMQPNELLFDPTQFNKCAEGVEYGLTNFTEIKETAFLNR